MCVARRSFRPLDPDVELFLKTLRHQCGLSNSAVNHATRHQDRKPRLFRDERTVADAFQSEATQRVATILQSIATDASAEDHDCLSIACLREIEGRATVKKAQEGMGDEWQRECQERHNSKPRKPATEHRLRLEQHKPEECKNERTGWW